MAEWYDKFRDRRTQEILKDLQDVKERMAKLAQPPAPKPACEEK